ncbi:uncharacterized protein LOC142615476 [Castanea sativa]|uniref:uncharacterized protein LOC142615476 n=1 Tax=Castanea sativa TaxID=21020 RepID=UPI003F64D7C4
MFNEIDGDFKDVAIRMFKVEEDQQQGKGKAKVIPQDRRDFRSERYNSNRPIRDFVGHAGPITAQVVNTVFRGLYHQDRGHTTKDCRTLCDYLKQLVKVRKLKQFLYQSTGQGSQVGSAHQRDASSRPPLGIINVIFAAPGRTGSYPSRVMSIARPYAEDLVLDSKRGRMEVRPTLNFSNEDKVGTFQPHDDALVVTLQIWEI